MFSVGGCQVGLDHSLPIMGSADIVCFLVVVGALDVQRIS